MNDDFLKEISDVCSESVDDIEFLKQQQWKVVYYCILLFGVILYLNNSFHDPWNHLYLFIDKFLFNIFMFALTFLVAFFGLCFLIDIQSALQKNRIRISKIRCKYFREETKKYFKHIKDKDIKSYRKFLKDGKYLFAFSTTIIIGFFVDSFVIYQCIPLTSISFILLVLPFIFIICCKNKKNKKINLDTNCDK